MITGWNHNERNETMTMVPTTNEFLAARGVAISPIHAPHQSSNNDNSRTVVGPSPVTEAKNDCSTHTTEPNVLDLSVYINHHVDNYISNDPQFQILLNNIVYNTVYNYTQEIFPSTRFQETLPPQYSETVATSSVCPQPLPIKSKIFVMFRANNQSKGCNSKSNEFLLSLISKKNSTASKNSLCKRYAKSGWSLEFFREWYVLPNTSKSLVVTELKNKFQTMVDFKRFMMIVNSSDCLNDIVEFLNVTFA